MPRKYYCYIIRADQYIKIGYTNSIDRRFETLQIGNPIQLELVEVFLHESAEDAEDHEAKLHYRFRRHHVRGEWFRARPVLKYLNRKPSRLWLWLLL